MKGFLLMFMTPILAMNAAAAIVTKEITYKLDKSVFKGFFTYDNSFKGKRPGVLVAHEWWGLNDFAKTQAKNLAEMGYAAFAVDLYGNGRTTNDPKIAAQMAGEIRGAPRTNYETGGHFSISRIDEKIKSRLANDLFRQYGAQLYQSRRW